MAGLLSDLGISIGLGGGNSPTPGPTATLSALTGQPATNLGPLTAKFTPPPECTVAVAACKTCDSALLYQGCDAASGPVDATSCWPPTSSGAPKASGSLHGWGFYSPGISCPVGYGSACTATAGGNNEWLVQFQLGDKETAVGCCPSGFACANIGGQTCIQVATSTAVPTASCQRDSIAGLGTMTLPDAAASITALSILAPMIQINFQSSDLDSATSSPSKSKSDGATSTSRKDGPTNTRGSSDGPSQTAATNAESASNGGNPGGSSIPMAAVIGSAVAGGIALLVVIVSGCWVWQKRIRRQRDAKEAELLDSLYASGRPQDIVGGEMSRYFTRPTPAMTRSVEEYAPVAPRSPGDLNADTMYRPCRM